MPRTAIPVTTLGRGGVVPPAQVDADSTSNHSVAGATDGKTWIEVVSSDLGSQTVAIPIPQQVDGQAVTARSVTVGAGVTKLIGPFSSEYQQADGSVWLNPSISTTLKFRAYRLP